MQQHLPILMQSGIDSLEILKGNQDFNTEAKQS